MIHIYDANFVKDIVLAPDSDAISESTNKFSKVNFNHIDSFNEVNIYAKKSIFDRKYGTTKYDGQINQYGITSKMPYRTNDFLLVGIDYKKFEDENLKNSATTTIKKDYTNKSLFITNSNEIKRLNKGTTIFTQSLRKDSYSNFDDKQTGKIGLKHHHHFLKGFTSSLNYGTSYKVPSLDKLYGQYGANENLKPQSSKSYDISLNYQNLTLTYFNTKITNMFGYTTKNINLDGTSKISGYEIDYKKSFI
jgi:vitamin B12 transporter